MVHLGIDEVATSTLTRQFQEAATVLNKGKLPVKVWVVYWAGTVVAAFISLEDAWHRLQHVKKGLDQNQEPTYQTKEEAELMMSSSLNEIANAPKYSSDSSTSSSLKLPKP